VKQWLQVVGISPQSVEALCIKFWSLETLQELCDHEIRHSFSECSGNDDEYRRLIRALQNIRKYTGNFYFQAFIILPLLTCVPFIVCLEVLLHTEKEGNSGRATPDLTLYWDSWDSGTKAPLLPSAPLHNIDTAMQATSPSILTNTNVQSTSSQSTKDNQTPPSTPSILNRRGNDEFDQANSVNKRTFFFLMID